MENLFDYLVAKGLEQGLSYTEATERAEAACELAAEADKAKEQ